MFTWLGTAALLPDSLLSNHPHRIGIYRRAVHAPVNHINPQQNERNTQQLSHIQQHTLLESLLIQLDELDEKTSQETSVTAPTISELNRLPRRTMAPPIATGTIIRSSDQI